jgi:hypothetical protein
LAAVKDILI